VKQCRPLIQRTCSCRKIDDRKRERNSQTGYAFSRVPRSLYMISHTYAFPRRIRNNAGGAGSFEWYREMSTGTDSRVRVIKGIVIRSESIRLKYAKELPMLWTLVPDRTRIVSTAYILNRKRGWLYCQRSSAIVCPELGYAFRVPSFEESPDFFPFASFVFVTIMARDAIHRFDSFTRHDGESPKR